MSDKPVRTVGPVALTNTLTTNIYQGGGGSALIADLIHHIHVANKSGSAATYSLWLGATGANAAGTELATAKSVAANDCDDLYFPAGLKMTSTDFLVGGASANTALTLTAMGKQIVV